MKFSPIQNRNKKKAVRFLRVIFPALGAHFLWERFWKEAKKPKTKFLLAETKAKANRKVLGIVAISTLFLLGKKFLHIKFLAVDPKIQKKGIGTSILRKIEKDAKASKYNFIFLTSRPARKKAHKFYQKNGFQRILRFLFWKRLK